MLLRYLPATLIIAFFVIANACQPKSDYERRVQKELQKDERVDSLFLGYKFGMTTDEFFEHSSSLNKQKLITGQRLIHYKLENLESTATMNFYPQFKDNKIYQMPVEVQYDGWAPWNKHLFADSLAVELIDYYEKRYGSEFTEVQIPETKKSAYIDINSNRQISITPKDDRIVYVEFLDLSVTESDQ